MNISLCITVLNEEKSIAKLLDSIFAGSKKPSEVVIVDAGSTDSTMSVIYNLQFHPSGCKPIYNKFSNINFQLIKKRHASIAQGRNLAIQKARGNVIVQTDAGCLVKRDWLEKLTEPFQNKEVDIVAGFYEMPASGPLQAALNVFHGVPPERFDSKSFIPSARSCAFRKAVWEKIGGYSEKLNGAGEDTLFFYDCVKNNFRIERVGEAKVIWEETRKMTLGKSFAKFYAYARGDAKIGIWWHPTKQLASHNIKISFIFVRYFLGVTLLFLLLKSRNPLLLVILFLLVILYLYWSIYKWRDVIKYWRGKLWLPIIQISSDLTVMLGFLSGLIVN